MSIMSDLYNIKNKYRFSAAKKRAVAYTNKFETVLSVIIGMLATVGILRSLLQAVS